MREIKFRVWNKKDKSFLKDKGRLFYYLNFYGGVIEEYNDGAGGYEVDFLDEKDFVVMQYTGLKDINGVEIYEGDIDKNFGEIYYNDKKTRYETRNPNVINTLHDINMYGSRPEIIGNIYQNPELIEDAETH